MKKRRLESEFEFALEDIAKRERVTIEALNALIEAEYPHITNKLRATRAYVLAYYQTLAKEVVS